MDPQFHPTDAQKRFFERHVFGEQQTILTLKRVKEERRGFSINIRGPFKFATYVFEHAETVIDATWAGVPDARESRSHMHCCWTEVNFFRLQETHPDVKKNIGYGWQLLLFKNAAETKTSESLFWFYLENENHKAVQTLPHDRTLPVADPVVQA